MLNSILWSLQNYIWQINLSGQSLTTAADRLCSVLRLKTHALVLFSVLNVYYTYATITFSVCSWVHAICQSIWLPKCMDKCKKNNVGGEILNNTIMMIISTSLFWIQFPLENCVLSLLTLDIFNSFKNIFLA